MHRDEWEQRACAVCEVCVCSRMDEAQSRVNAWVWFSWSDGNLSACHPVVTVAVSLHTCELSANCFEINPTSFHTNLSSMLCWIVEALLSWVNRHRSTGILYLWVFFVLYFLTVVCQTIPDFHHTKILCFDHKKEKERLKTMTTKTDFLNGTSIYQMWSLLDKEKAQLLKSQ